MRKNLLADTDFTKGHDNRFKSTVMIGKVVSLECTATQANVRVQLPDRINNAGKQLITRPIPVLQPAANGKKSFAMPRIGTDVLVAKLPNSTSDYVVLGCFYTQGNPPPVTDPKLDHVEYDDGSVIEFASGTMTWNLKGGISFTCVGDLTLKSSGTVLVDAPTVHLKGAMNLEGNINHTGNMTTTGHHTDAGGHHTSSSTDLSERLSALEARVAELERGRSLS